MFGSTPFPLRFTASLCALALASALLAGCTVVTIAGTAASAAVTGVGLAADVAVGTVKLTGKAIGAVLPGGGE